MLYEHLKATALSFFRVKFDQYSYHSFDAAKDFIIYGIFEKEAKCNE
jgi:hypothetical protein